MQEDQQAFPVPYPGSGGMTLRDYFAAKAMIIACKFVLSPDAVARMSYEIADCMLRESQKIQPAKPENG